MAGSPSGVNALKVPLSLQAFLPDGLEYIGPGAAFLDKFVLFRQVCELTRRKDARQCFSAEGDRRGPSRMGQPARPKEVPVKKAGQRKFAGHSQAVSS
jgi:hypothetical protein